MSSFDFLNFQSPADSAQQTSGFDFIGGQHGGATNEAARPAPSVGLDAALDAFGLRSANDAPVAQLRTTVSGNKSAPLPPPDFTVASAAVLKKYLESHGVDHRACVEKSDLVALARATAAPATSVGLGGGGPSRANALVQGLGNAFELHGLAHLAPVASASINQELQVGAKSLSKYMQCYSSLEYHVCCVFLAFSTYSMHQERAQEATGRHLTPCSCLT
jgi:hypothetical protein